MDRDFIVFITQQLDYPFARTGCLFTGSTAELPVIYYLFNFTDIDLMVFPIDTCAISSDDEFPAAFNKVVYLIENVCEYPGYVRLENDGYYLRKEDIIYSAWPTNGPANRTELYTAYLEQREINMKIPVDAVRCIYSPYWPKVASEWVTRKRLNGWPTADVVDRIVRGGIHFVAKPHPKCPEDNTMFRCSFSRAEVVLLNSFSEIQKYVYHIIRVVKKNLEKALNHGGYESPLCTYHFKTLMLWACEEKSPEFWSENAIESSIEKLLLQMIEWLIEKNLPNYFIARYNLLDYIDEQKFDFEEEINCLLNCVINIKCLVNNTPIVQPHMTSLNISISNKILVILDLVLNRNSLYFSPLDTHLNEHLRAFKNKAFSHLIIKEFTNLYQGIRHHFRFLTGRESSRHLHRLKALQRLNEAYVDDQRRSFVSFPTGNTLLDFIERCVFGEKFHVQDFESQNHTVLMNGIRKSFMHETPNSGRFKSQSISLPETINKYEHTAERRRVIDCQDNSMKSETNLEYLFNCGQLLINGFDRLPKISYFVSAAYLANFYYTALKDRDLAGRICREALEMSPRIRSVYGHGHQHGDLCPIVLNNKSIVLFDSQIQTVFGFAVLCNAIHSMLNKKQTGARMSLNWSSDHKSHCAANSSPYSIFQLLTPIEFLEYVQHRCKFTTLYVRNRASWRIGRLGRCSNITQCHRSWFLTAALKIGTLQ